VRILHVDSAASWRGGQNQVLLTATGMAERGHDVRIACRSRGMLCARARVAGLGVRPLWFQGEVSPLAMAGLLHLNRTFRPDVVHVHDPHALAAAVWSLGPETRRRLVATRRVDFAPRGRLSRRKYGRPALIVAVSQAIRDVLVTHRIPPERVRVIYEGVSERAPAPQGRQALLKLGIPEDAEIVGNVAALTDHKDHATLIEAAAIVAKERSRAYFVIVGDGELRSSLEERIRSRGISSRVILTGFRADVDALLPAFDLFCLSSHMEGLGTSLLDAMMFGLPVVATDAGGIPEAVEDGVTGRVVPRRNAPALAAAISQSLADTDQRSAWGQKGRDRWQRLFSADRMVSETLALYRELR